MFKLFLVHRYQKIAKIFMFHKEDQVHLPKKPRKEYEYKICGTYLIIFFIFRYNGRISMPLQIVFLYAVFSFLRFTIKPHIY